MDIATSTAAPAGRSVKRRSKANLVIRNSRPQARHRFSITLSDKSAEAFNWLKEHTDADTDSEVIRNALRLHYVLLQKAKAGETFFTGSTNKPDQLTKIELFVSK